MLIPVKAGRQLWAAADCLKGQSQRLLIFLYKSIFYIIIRSFLIWESAVSEYFVVVAETQPLWGVLFFISNLNREV